MAPNWTKLIAAFLACAVLCIAQCVNVCEVAPRPEPPKSSCHGGEQPDSGKCSHEDFVAAPVPESQFVAVLPLESRLVEAPLSAMPLVAATLPAPPPTLRFPLVPLRI